MNDKSTMDETMKITMLIMTFGCWAYTIAIAMQRVRNIILEREHGAQWVRELIGEKA
jgi:heme exporter protein C